MLRSPVNSSVFKSVGHDPKTSTLEIEFKEGGVHQYSGVDTRKYKMFVQSKSLGGFFHSHIKTVHSTKKVG